MIERRQCLGRVFFPKNKYDLQFLVPEYSPNADQNLTPIFGRNSRGYVERGTLSTGYTKRVFNMGFGNTHVQ